MNITGLYFIRKQIIFTHIGKTPLTEFVEHYFVRFPRFSNHFPLITFSSFQDSYGFIIGFNYLPIFGIWKDSHTFVQLVGKIINTNNRVRVCLLICVSSLSECLLTRFVYHPRRCQLMQTGQQAGRHLFLAALRANGWQANGRHSGGKESEKDGRRRTIR